MRLLLRPVAANSCRCPPSQCETQSVRQGRSPLVEPAKEKMDPRHHPGMISRQRRHIFEAATCMLACLLVIPKLCGNCHLQRWQNEKSESSQNPQTRTFQRLQLCNPILVMLRRAATSTHSFKSRTLLFSSLPYTFLSSVIDILSPDHASRWPLLLKLHTQHFESLSCTPALHACHTCPV